MKINTMGIDISQATRQALKIFTSGYLAPAGGCWTIYVHLNDSHKVLGELRDETVTFDDIPVNKELAEMGLRYSLFYRMVLHPAEFDLSIGEIQEHIKKLQTELDALIAARAQRRST